MISMVQLVATESFHAAHMLLCADDGEIAAGSSVVVHLPPAVSTNELSWELLPGYQGWTILID